MSLHARGRADRVGEHRRVPPRERANPRRRLDPRRRHGRRPRGAAGLGQADQRRSRDGSNRCPSRATAAPWKTSSHTLPAAAPRWSTAMRRSSSPALPRGAAIRRRAAQCLHCRASDGARTAMRCGGSPIRSRHSSSDSRCCCLRFRCPDGCGLSFGVGIFAPTDSRQATSLACSLLGLRRAPSRRGCSSGRGRP